MTQLQQKVVVPDAVMEKLDAVRGRTLQVRIGTAIVAALGVLFAAMAVAMLVDWLAVLYDSRWRLVLTYSSMGVALLTLGVWMLTAWRQSQQLHRAAREVDDEIPQIEERWSTIAQLSSSPHADQVHPAMYRKVAQEANSWSSQVEPGQVVSLERLIRSLWCLMAITLVLGLAVLIDSRRTSVLLQRFWAPWSSISATELTEPTGNTVVARGEPLEIAATLEGVPVKRATLYLEPTKGDPHQITLAPKGKEGNRLSHRVRSVDSQLRYRLRAGDGQTEWFQVEVADRPEIGEVEFKVSPPVYTGLEPKVFNKFPKEVSTLIGSLLQLAIKPKMSVESVELRLGGENSEKIKVDSKGWYRWETTLEESFSFSPILTEKHGLTNLRAPTCEVKALEDAPPVVKILKPDNQIAVLPNDKVPIEFSAKDDLGIGSAELLVYDDSLAVDGEPIPLATIPIPLGDKAGATEIQGSVELDLSPFDLSDGSQLSFAVRVSEDRSAVANNQQPSGAVNPGKENEATTADNQSADGESNDSPIADKNPLDENIIANNNENSSNDAANQINNSNQRSNLSGEQPGNSKVANADSLDPNSDANEAISEEISNIDASELAANNPQGSSSEQPAADPTQQPQEGLTPSTPQPSELAEDSPLADSVAGGDSQTSPTEDNNSTTAANGNNSDSQQTAANATPAGDDQQADPSQSASSAQMQTGYLRVPQAQSGSSNRMQLMVDKTVGSFDVQQRLELELAIAPILEALDISLGKAQKLSRSTLDGLEKNPKWLAEHGRDVTKAEEHIADALNTVDKLQNRTRGTLYSFIGLQIVDISQAHIYPARQDFWKALQTEGDGRKESVSNGWQHTSRARDLLERLTGQFERARRDYALADTVDKIKKMYQLYVENSLALMREGGDSSPYARKMAEFDLDDEYLARLKEVLEMRNKMRQELARILADDPRLLRRFLDAQRNQTRVLRNELADLVDRQGATNRKVKAWNVVEEERRSDLANILLQRHVKGIEEIALSAADLHDRFETWLPLERDAEDADLQATGELLQQIAVSTREVSASAGGYAGRRTGFSPTASAEPTGDDNTEAGDSPAEEAEVEEDSSGLETIIADAEQLYEQFNRLEVLLGQLGMREGQVEIAGFAARRLVDTRRLIEQTSAWLRQLQFHQAGEFHRAAEIEQYQLAMATDSLAGKLADIEQELSAVLQIQDGTLPEPIADRARALLTTLDEQVSPNQLGAVYGLRRNQLPRAISRQQAALDALKLAEKEYDEMMRLVITELDKFPVQDPIASLLDDPTLDELLAQLENEGDIRELLGIPQRPTNLRIMDDWISGQMGGNGNNIGYNSNRVLLNQMREEQLKRQQAIERAYRKALARAMKESEAEGVVVEPSAPAQVTVDWNSLASRLSDDLQQGRNSAPPERYRQAIEQYFRQISGATEE